MLLRIALLLVVCSANAHEIAGVHIAPRVHVGASELVLNGAGLRSWAMFNIYVAKLYLPERRASVPEVLALPGPKRFAMTFLRDTTAAELTQALEEGLRDNHPAAEFERYRARIARLAAVMAAVGLAKKGSLVAIDYLPGTGTRVMLNGQAQGAPIEGDDFYAALLRIWLGDTPPDATLKSRLLGHSS